MSRYWLGLLLVVVWLSGSGVARAAPQISVAPLSLEFSNVEVGHTSPTQRVAATNTSNATLTITSVTSSAGGSNHTVSRATGRQTVPQDMSVRRDIARKSQVQGRVAEAFQRVSSSPAGGPTSVTQPGSSPQGSIATDQTTLDFGAVPLNSSVTKILTLSNPGTVAVTGITANNPTSGYSIDSSTPVPTTLAPGTPVALKVKFAPVNPTDGGAATLTFSGDAGPGNPVTTDVTLAGQTQSFSVTPTALDFGNFLFDSAPTKVFRIKADGTATISIDSVVFTPDASTANTEVPFTITQGGAPVTLPDVLAPGEQFDVTVKLTPNNRMGLVSGQFLVHPGAAGLSDQTVTVTGNATAAILTATMLVDFGAVDIDGPSPMQTAMIQNTGTAPLNISSITKMSGASNAFTITLPAGAVQVMPGTPLTIPITYKPTIEQGPSSFDTVVLVANLTTGTGVLNEPRQAMITVRGRGIDRHLKLQATPTFPPTFRNPGDMAPVRALTVQNTGEALLKISAVMITGDPVWQLVDPSPVDIQGGTSHDFMIKFSPTMVGPAPTGQLILVNNDNNQTMAKVTLTGNGIGRNVAFGPNTIDLGFTGVGIPITVSDLLAVTNMDPAVQFTIHAIQLSDTAAFRIDDAPADVELPAAMAKNFAITFDPTAVGDFTTTATLYLDQDQEQQAEVQITGHAVFVHAHGGGGCDAGGAGAGGGSALAFGVLVAISALGRRRRRSVGLGIAATALVATIAIAPAVRAGGIGISVFEPTPATTGSGFQLQSPEIGEAGSWAASTILSYASHPLVLDVFAEGGALRDTPITRSTLLQLGGAYAFLGRFEVGAHMPLYMQSGDPLNPMSSFTARPASGTATGDLTLHVKARLWRRGDFVAGTSAIGEIPTATKDQFTGSDKPAARLLLLGSFTPAVLRSRWTISANAGAIVRSKSVYADIMQQSGAAWGAGTSFRVLDKLSMIAEIFGEFTPSGQLRQSSSNAMPPAIVLEQIEWLAGVSYKMDRRFTIGLAAGRGVTGGLGTPDLRGVLSLAFVPHAAAIATIHPFEPPRPDGDADGDGIIDWLDRCPNEPEDKDGFQDADGCPDLDNDHDGIPDAIDKCPNQAEDKDGFQDADGCPDPDNDGDGIPDALDKCPNQPETVNGKEDADGCPDTVDTTSVAAPDPGSPTKAAEDTFARGRELMKQGNYAAACAEFEQSQRLDPQFGTQYNLAGCYEKTGKLATAWNLYRELARGDTNATRRAKAAGLAGSLARRVPKLKLVLPKKPNGVQVSMNGANANALIGIETPVDLGSYGLVVGATGYRTWRKTVDITEETKVVTVMIDLEPVH